MGAILSTPANAGQCQLEENMAAVFEKLLPRILNELSAHSLLHTARLVSKTWRDEATAILLSKNMVQTVFRFSRTQRKFVQLRLKRDKGTSKSKDKDSGYLKTLDDLTQMLTSYPLNIKRTFPSTSFLFHSGGLNDLDALAFFEYYGREVKELTVEIHQNPPTPHEVLQTKIFTLLPNLETLQFLDNSPDNDLPSDWAPQAAPVMEPEPDPEEQLVSDLLLDLDRKKVLPLLRHLKFYPMADSTYIWQGYKLYAVLEQIRPLTGQLDKISVDTFSVPEAAEFLQPLTQVAPLYIERGEIQLNSSLVNLRRVSQSRIFFKTLSLFTNCPKPLDKKEWIKMTQSLMNILENTQTSLKFLHCTVDCFLFLTRLEFSPEVFQNLQTLHIDFENADRWSKAESVEDGESSQNFDPNNPNLNFPGEAVKCWKNLAEVMPSLNKLYIELYNGPCEHWLPFLEKSGQNVGIREIQIWKASNPNILKKLLGCLPSVEKLAVSEIPGIPTGPNQGAFSSLEELLKVVNILDEEPGAPRLSELKNISLNFETCKSPEPCDVPNDLSTCRLSQLLGDKTYSFDLVTGLYTTHFNEESAFDRFEEIIPSTAPFAPLLRVNIKCGCQLQLAPLIV